MSETAKRIDEASVQRRLGAKDWQHSLGTAAAAADMAARFGVDVEKARIAGLLHDYARNIALDELPVTARRLGLDVDEVEEEFPYLLHSPVGAKLVQEELGVTDNDVLAAIANHTVGRPGMSDLEKIIYLADMIEPARHFEGADSIRELAATDLDAAFRLGYALSLRHLVESGKLIHPRTAAVWNWLNSKRGA